jgi:phage shock protein A
MTALERRYAAALHRQQLFMGYARNAKALRNDDLAALNVEIAQSAAAEAREIEREIADHQEALDIIRETKPAPSGVRQFLANFKRAIPTAMTVGQWR